MVSFVIVPVLKYLNIFDPPFLSFVEMGFVGWVWVWPTKAQTQLRKPFSETQTQAQ
jgi:hypothetical protein